MAFSVIAHTAKGSSDAANVTTDAINTTGADLIVACLTAYTLSAPTLSDNKSNTWTRLTQINGGGRNPDVVMFYSRSPTVGSGHTFTSTGSAPTLAVVAISGSLLSVDPFDHENGATAGGSSVQPGSCAATGLDLFITFFGVNGATVISTSVGSGFTILDAVAFGPGAHYGGFLAWLESSSAQNPTWTTDGGGDSTAAIASFQPAVVASGQPAIRRFGRVPLGVEGVRIY